MKDLFPQELKEAKRYRSQKNKLSKVMAKQYLEEDFTDESIEFVLRCLREEGPTNLLGIWVKARELMGDEAYKKARTDITNITMCLNLAGKLWRHELPHHEDLIFGIRGEQSKKEYLERIKIVE